MSRARSLVVSVIQGAKGKSYVVDPEIPMRGLLGEIGQRGRSLLRAQWSFRGVRGGRLRFAENGVEIRHRRSCTIGRGSVIEAQARLHCLGRTGVSIGAGVTVGKFSIIECTGVLTMIGAGVTIGDGSALGDYTFIGAAGGVEIGSGVLMGQRVSIHSQNHEYSDPSVPIARQGTTQRGVRIRDDCWIGSGAIILDGVELGQGCVVAAGAVVTKSFPPNSVLAGVPAKVIQSRGHTSASGTGSLAVAV